MEEDTSMLSVIVDRSHKCGTNHQAADLPLQFRRKKIQTIIPGWEHCRRKWKNEKTKSETLKVLKTLRRRITVEKRNHKFFFWTWANRVKHWQYFRQERWRKEALLLIKKAIFVYVERKKYNGWYSTKNIYILLAFYKNVNCEPEVLREGRNL